MKLPWMEWETALTIAVVIFFLVGVFACGSNPPAIDNSADVQWKKIGDVHSVTRLDVDGVDCVIYDGYESGGISCDWAGR